ncbi:MAG: CBS domain-containing protein [Elusimicrobia bacterium]|nr:CBS domain-containing protein [Elusimicrobiota bacterium]
MDFYNYLSRESSFHVNEDSFVFKKQNARESVFTLGNGYIGSRGIYEENPSRSNPGTFIQGLYAKSGAQVEEIINLPNPVHLIISVEGEKFDISTMKVLEHKRTLDMKNGFLVRKTLYRDAKEREFLYQSIRFFSMARPHTGAMKVNLKLIKGKANLTSVDRLDDTVYNSGGLMLPRRRHYNATKISRVGDCNYMEFETNTHNHRVGYCTHKVIDYENSSTARNGSLFDFSLESGQEISFTKMFTIYTSNETSVSGIKKATTSELKDCVALGFEGLLKEHMECFSHEWEDTDIKITGSLENQQAIRFNIYHLLIAAREEFASSSIGARTLSGQGYRGHVFWDTEIYILPFFIFTQPETARQLLMFRYNTLPQARMRASEHGFDGAMYPWESTVSGHEQTPRYAKSIDGTIGEVTTQDYEHHITADVAYGVYHYYSVTDDIEFMHSFGVEIVFETAKFWASRVEYSEKDKLYHIDNITGPDEFHVNIKDNAFTNYMAAWNLRYAAELYSKFKEEKKLKTLLRKLKINASTVKNWEEIGNNIAFKKSSTYKIINQFDGYMRLKDYKARNYDMYFLPEIPMYYERIGLDKTRLIKQPDVLALFQLFPDDFSEKEKLRNYDYYIYRTIHKSSLSYCFHTIIAAEVGDFFRSYVFFRAASAIDLKDIAGNTNEGIHAASLGGVWQAVLMGFAGLRVNSQGLKITPRLPGTIKDIAFVFYYKGTPYKLKVSNKKIQIKYSGETSCKELNINGKKIILKAGVLKTIKVEEDAGMTVYAKDIMKKEKFVTTGENSTIGEIGRLISENKASIIPIVDGDNMLKGIVSETIIIEALSKENFSSLKASDIMEEDVITVKHNEHLEKLTEIFTKHSFRRLPVIDKGKVVGIITRDDIIADFLGGYY